VLVTGARRVLVLLLVVVVGAALAVELAAVGAALATLPLVLSLLLAVGAALATLPLVLSLLTVGAAFATLLLVGATLLLVGATLTTATGALVEVVASWFTPKATQPPSVPTRAALAIADLSFAASRGRRLVSRGFISMLLPRLPALVVSPASIVSGYQGDIQFRRRWRWDEV
jgi:hypothetical protein